MCGGTPTIFPAKLKPPGLSPRVRGNPLLTQSELTNLRSIPACAGEPRRNVGTGNPLWVYPRVCGGTRAATRQDLVAKGLSPRVRGNPARVNPRSLSQRSIPACAGEPLSCAALMKGGAVYPRVCGGTFTTQVEQNADYGLSPRVRGNLLLDDLHAAPNRSIPACAGEPLANVIEYATYYSQIEYC